MPSKHKSKRKQLASIFSMKSLIKQTVFGGLFGAVMMECVAATENVLQEHISVLK